MVSANNKCHKSHTKAISETHKEHLMSHVLNVMLSMEAFICFSSWSSLNAYFVPVLLINHDCKINKLLL